MRKAHRTLVRFDVLPGEDFTNAITKVGSDTLRRLAEEEAKILRATPMAKEIRTNWRDRVQTLVPRYNSGSRPDCC